MNAQIIKAHCPACGQHIEYPPEQAGSTIPCPSCSQRLNLPMPAKSNADKSLTKTALVISAALISMALAVVGWLIFANWETVSESAGIFGGIAGFLLISLAALCLLALIIYVAVLWLIFPVFVFSKLDRVIGLLASIDRQSRGED